MRSDIESLRDKRAVREIERSFARGCDRPGFRLVHYSLQGNHAHLIVEADDRDALGRGMKAIGSRLARAVNRVTEHAGRVLAERYHHHELATPKEPPERAGACEESWEGRSANRPVRPGVVRTVVRRLEARALAHASSPGRRTDRASLRRPATTVAT
jgi:hypothetical protein